MKQTVLGGETKSFKQRETNLMTALTVTANLAVTLLSHLSVTGLTAYYKRINMRFVTDDSKISFFQFYVAFFMMPYFLMYVLKNAKIA